MRTKTMKSKTKKELIDGYERILTGRHYRDSNTKIIEERLKELKSK